MDSIKLYVGNLPYKTTSKDLIKLFVQFGEVLEAMVIPNKKQPGLSKGFGFVTFANKEEADKALELNDTEFEGRKLVVAIAKSPEEDEKQKTAEKKRGDRPMEQGEQTIYESQE